MRSFDHSHLCFSRMKELYTQSGDCWFLLIHVLVRRHGGKKIETIQ